MTKTEMFNEAVKYINMGFSIIPVGVDKRPLIAWREYQERRTVLEEIIEWFRQFPGMNIAVVTGKISNIVVVDVEASGKTDWLLPTVISKTGGGGWHFYYKYPGHHIGNATRIRPETDIRADGGYAILPPSLHVSGKRYEWAVSPEMADFAELPEIPELAKDIKEPEGNNWGKILSTINHEGVRNSTAAQVAGKFVSELQKKQLESIGWLMFQDWDQRQNDPPLGKKELRSVWDSICKKHLSERTKTKSENQKTFKPIHISELMAKEFTDPAWLVENLIPAGGITALSGTPGSYKTWVMLELAIKVAGGNALFDKFQTSQGGVLIVDEENGERLFHQRFQKLGNLEGLDIHILSWENFKLNDDSVNTIKTYCKDKNIKLIIFDSLIRIHSGNENDAKDMSAVAGMLKQIAKEGMTIIFTHHNRKSGIFRSSPSQEMRGSSDILASVDCHIAIDRKEKLFTIKQTKSRHAEEIKSFQLKFCDDNDQVQFEFVGELDEAKSTIEELKEVIKNILEQEGRPMFKKELLEKISAAGIKGGKTSLNTAIKELKEAGELLQASGKGNRQYLSLVESGEEQDLVDSELEEYVEY